MKVDICCIARNENLTIDDWVTYHINQGIHKIWIIDNNDEGDLSLNIILKDKIKNGKVEIISTFKGAKSFQIKAYNWFLSYYNNQDIYDYVGFLDCDEYLTINTDKYNDVGKFFEIVERECPNIGTLSINWECYGDNEQYYYEYQPVVERFPIPLDYNFSSCWNLIKENYHIKSFVKSKVEAHFGWNSHNCIIVNQEIAYNSDFKPILGHSPWVPNVTYNNAKIRHYCTKSLEEYLYRKYGTICADNQFNKPYTMEYYWKRNKKTKEAIKAFNDIITHYHFG